MVNLFGQSNLILAAVKERALKNWDANFEDRAMANCDGNKNKQTGTCINTALIC